MSQEAPPGAATSTAVARNTVPIQAVLAAHLPATGRVLELAAGTGEHALAFSRAFPGLTWQPTDVNPEALASIAAWREAKGPPTLLPPIGLDVTDEAAWPEATFDALICINMVHISPWAATEALMRLAQARLVTGGLLYLYGPWIQDGVETAASNLAFDESLKARNPDWGLRGVEDVRRLAREGGLALTLEKPMPANNLSLLFRRI